MKTRHILSLALLLAAATDCLVLTGRGAEPPAANEPAAPGPDGSPGFDRPPGFDGPPPFGPDGMDGPPPGFMPGGFGPGGGGPGGPGGMNQERKVVSQFDKDGDGRLSSDERKPAREFLKQQGANRGPGGPGGRRGGFGGPGGPGGQSREPGQPGRKLTPADVQSFADAPVYDASTLRTFFLEFENADWEKELGDFNNTDVEVPAKVIVDGKTYADVGVHFRGNTSMMFAGEGRKRPLNLSFDFVHKDQNLGGYRTFNLLNAHEDPSFLRAMLYLEIARDYHPAPKANFVRVVINGECWGIYTSMQQFNKDFVQDWFGTTKGARWKVPGSPQTRAGLEYLGDDPAPYRRLYTIKTKDTPEVWAEFVRLCRTLNQTDLDKLPEALEPILDVDSALRFLAVELVLINSDGYWVRSSDYNLYQDKTGKFHILPHDINEALSGAGGPGMGGPGGGFMGRGGRGNRGGFGPNAGGGPGAGIPLAGGPVADPSGAGVPERGVRGPGFRGGPGGGGGGIELDPLVALTDSTKPLRSRLLAVPEYRARYLGYVREIAEKWLDWERLGPIAQKYHDLIDEDVKLDTRKLDSYAAFEKSLQSAAAAPASPGAAAAPGRAGFGREKPSLKDFSQKRRAYLLSHPEVSNAVAR
jgi:hypothetical protein